MGIYIALGFVSVIAIAIGIALAKQKKHSFGTYCQ